MAMDDLINEIEFAVKSNAWLLALAGTLALPDICAAIQSPSARTTGSKYKAWVTRYLGPSYPGVDPEELYQMRCSFLHQGTSSAAQYHRVLFMSRESGSRIHNAIMDDALVLDMPTFCADTIAAVRAWQIAVGETDTYKRNVDLVMRWHRGGFGRFIVGPDVLT